MFSCTDNNFGSLVVRGLSFNKHFSYKAREMTFSAKNLIALLTLFAIFKCAESVTFYCNYMEADYYNLGPKYTCRLTNIVPGSSDVLVLPVIGSHMIGKGNGDVLCLHNHEQQQITRIPRDVENVFPNLECIIWNPGNLASISSEELKFPNLLALSLSINQIVTLDGDLFQYNPNLVRIAFNNNLLQHVGYGLLTNLNQLAFAYFENNPCVNQFAITPERIQELKLQLPLMCLEECSFGCSMKLGSLEEEIFSSSDGLMGLIVQLQDSSAKHEGEIIKQNENIITLEREMSDAIVELSRNLAASNEILMEQISELRVLVNTQKDDLEAQSQEITSLQGKLTDLGEDVSAQNEQISIQHTKISELQGQVSGLETDLSSQKAEIAEQRQNISELKSQVITQKDDIIAQNLAISNLYAQINVQNGSIAALVQKTDSHNATISNHTSRIVTLEYLMEIVIGNCLIEPKIEP